jgi:hypothetical protein
VHEPGGRRRIARPPSRYLAGAAGAPSSNATIGRKSSQGWSLRRSCSALKGRQHKAWRRKPQESIHHHPKAPKGRQQTSPTQKYFCSSGSNTLTGNHLREILLCGILSQHR